MDFLATYIWLIDWICTTAGTTHDVMHVHVGMALFLLAQLAIRTRRGSVIALRFVFTMEILNEAFERLYYGEWRWADTLGDIAMTMLWPTAITIVSLYRRRQWEIRERQQRALIAMVQSGLSPATR